MDGKRRYQIELSYIGEQVFISKEFKNLGSTIHCRLRILNNRKNGQNKSKKRWPFNEKDRHIDIWLAESLDFFPTKVQISWTFWKYRGKYSR